MAASGSAGHATAYNNACPQGCGGKVSGACAPHRFTERQAPPKKKDSEGPVQTTSGMQTLCETPRQG